MITGDTLYTARFQLPDDLPINRAQVISCPVYRDGAVVAPSSGQVTIYDAGGAVIVTATVTISSSIAQYSISSSLLTSMTPGDGWQIRWSLTIAGQVYVFTNSAACVRSVLYPVITDLDLIRMVPVLDHSTTGAITTQTTFQEYIDSSWTEIVARIISKGQRPSLILDPTALRNVHIYLTLSMILGALSVGMNDDYKQLSTTYYERYSSAWSELSFKYDADDDGVVDQHKRVASTLWLRGW